MDGDVKGDRVGDLDHHDIVEAPDQQPPTDHQSAEWRSFLELQRLMIMREDIAEWISTTLDGVQVTEGSLLDALKTGAIVCKIATTVEQHAAPFHNGTLEQVDLPRVRFLAESASRKCGDGRARLRYFANAEAGSFLARDNTVKFLNWCRSLGLQDAFFFESNDLVDGRNEKVVLACLYELIRFAAQFGIAPSQLVQAELDIDQEEEIGRGASDNEVGSSSEGDFDTDVDEDGDEEEEDDDDEEEEVDEKIEREDSDADNTKIGDGGDACDLSLHYLDPLMHETAQSALVGNKSGGVDAGDEDGATTDSDDTSSEAGPVNADMGDSGDGGVERRPLSATRTESFFSGISDYMDEMNAFSDDDVDDGDDDDDDVDGGDDGEANPCEGHSAVDGGTDMVVQAEDNGEKINEDGGMNHHNDDDAANDAADDEDAAAADDDDDADDADDDEAAQIAESSATGADTNPSTLLLDGDRNGEGLDEEKCTEDADSAEERLSDDGDDHDAHDAHEDDDGKSSRDGALSGDDLIEEKRVENKENEAENGDAERLQQSKQRAKDELDLLTVTATAYMTEIAHFEKKVNTLSARGQSLLDLLHSATHATQPLEDSCCNVMVHSADEFLLNVQKRVRETTDAIKQNSKSSSSSSTGESSGDDSNGAKHHHHNALDEKSVSLLVAELVSDTRVSTKTLNDGLVASTCLIADVVEENAELHDLVREFVSDVNASAELKKAISEMHEKLSCVQARLSELTSLLAEGNSTTVEGLAEDHDVSDNDQGDQYDRKRSSLASHAALERFSVQLSIADEELQTVTEDVRTASDAACTHVNSCLERVNEEVQTVLALNPTRALRRSVSSSLSLHQSELDDLTDKKDTMDRIRRHSIKRKETKSIRKKRSSRLSFRKRVKRMRTRAAKLKALSVKLSKFKLPRYPPLDLSHITHKVDTRTPESFLKMQRKRRASDAKNIVASRASVAAGPAINVGGVRSKVDTGLTHGKKKVIGKRRESSILSVKLFHKKKRQPKIADPLGVKIQEQITAAGLGDTVTFEKGDARQCYLFNGADKAVPIREVRNHLMVRTGGAWETLLQYVHKVAATSPAAKATSGLHRPQPKKKPAKSPRRKSSATATATATATGLLPQSSHSPQPEGEALSVRLDPEAEHEITPSDTSLSPDHASPLPVQSAAVTGAERKDDDEPSVGGEEGLSREESAEEATVGQEGAPERDEGGDGHKGSDESQYAEGSCASEHTTPAAAPSISLHSSATLESGNEKESEPDFPRKAHEEQQVAEQDGVGGHQQTSGLSQVAAADEPTSKAKVPEEGEDHRDDIVVDDAEEDSSREDGNGGIHETGPHHQEEENVTSELLSHVTVESDVLGDGSSVQQASKNGNNRGTPPSSPKKIKKRDAESKPSAPKKPSSSPSQRSPATKPKRGSHSRRKPSSPLLKPRAQQASSSKTSPKPTAGAQKQHRRLSSGSSPSAKKQRTPPVAPTLRSQATGPAPRRKSATGPSPAKADPAFAGQRRRGVSLSATSPARTATASSPTRVAARRRSATTAKGSPLSAKQSVTSPSKGARRSSATSATSGQRRVASPSTAAAATRRRAVSNATQPTTPLKGRLARSATSPSLQQKKKKVAKETPAKKKGSPLSKRQPLQRKAPATKAKATATATKATATVKRATKGVSETAGERGTTAPEATTGGTRATSASTS